MPILGHALKIVHNTTEALVTLVHPTCSNSTAAVALVLQDLATLAIIHCSIHHTHNQMELHPTDLVVVTCRLVILFNNLLRGWFI